MGNKLIPSSVKIPIYQSERMVNLKSMKLLKGIFYSSFIKLFIIDQKAKSLKAVKLNQLRRL
jgi:hypothetical protein